jgi:GNAT superfamily N-acetyltransferase
MEVKMNSTGYNPEVEEAKRMKSDILQDLSPTNLVTAIEGNLFGWIPVFGQLKGGQVTDTAQYKRCITDIPMALFNSIMDARLAHEEVDATIQTLVSDAGSRGVPVMWWIGPSTQPVDLGEHLKKHGFMLNEDSPGMAVDLAKLNEKLISPEGFSIQQAQDDDAFWQWSRTCLLAFGAPPTAELAMKAWHDLLAFSKVETIQAYIGWLDNKPVATSLLILAGGVAGIYAVATMPEARRKGIGARITLHPLLLARAMGYKAGVLGASEMGESVYRSLGFQDYCRLSSYVWQPEPKGEAGA